MNGEPRLNEPQLFDRDAAGKEFAINSDGCLIFIKVNVHMRFMVLIVIFENHLYNDAKKSA